MDCPRCRCALVAHQAPRFVMQCCYGCGGVFLDSSSSRTVVSAIDPHALAAAENVARRAAAPVATDATIPCPSCTKPLERTPIAAAGVTVDVCRDHGVWFDRDELQRVVHAVAPQRQTPIPMAPNVGAPPPPPPLSHVAPPPPVPHAAPPPPPVSHAAPPPPPPVSHAAPPVTLQSGAASPFAGASAAVPYVTGAASPAPIAGGASVQPAIVSQPAAAPPPIVPASSPMQPPQATAPLPPGMAPGQYVPPGWLEGQGASPGLFGGGAPQAPGQPAQQGWGLGKTALAVGAGVAAVAGVAYVASHTDVGRSLMGTKPSQEGFSAVGDVLSRLF